MAPSIVLVGLPHNHPAVPADLQEIVRTGLEQAREAVQTLPYPVTYEFLPFTPEEPIDNLKNALKQRNVDGVVIGLGIRGNVPLTPFFEKIVNAVVEARPGAKLMFNTDPKSTVDAIQRWFGKEEAPAYTADVPLIGS
ncbi:hypothetical protein HK097_000930 [Rhizophlyctis rosea]|uniref:Uncharacterized protein n=1 Tax=Rhizophlyctis rosea TaxID=64517 RepID=A0AAD5SHQ0_9FUNG|nr:hypothetical protein HK097_000930 [Rhizophlyctis rosea]